MAVVRDGGQEKGCGTLWHGCWMLEKVAVSGVRRVLCGCSADQKMRHGSCGNALGFAG